MTNTNKEIARASDRRKEVTSPTATQILRQLGVIGLVIVIWSGLLVLTIKLTGKEVPPSTSLGEPGEYDLEALTTAFTEASCTGCHVIPGISGAVGRIGPDLTQMGEQAAAYLEEGIYSGSAEDVEAFIRESILDPDAFIAPECPGGPCQPGQMPVAAGAQLSESELAQVVDYLASLPIEELGTEPVE
jgi:mono/diheme cytochrome c family protein